MARLILTLNNDVISTHSIAPGEKIGIGRHPDNQIVIDNLAVSAHHATVRLDGQTLLLSDLGSRNGTLVNNEKVSESLLAHQDWVTVGKHTLIVDLYETLSLESSADQLIGRASASFGADQTMMLDREAVNKGWVGFDYLSFLSAGKEDFELKEVVTIGKNPDADIKITGFWALVAGEPSVTITRNQNEYILAHAGGMLKPKINGISISGPTKLNHQDIVKIGPVELQIRCVRRPSM